MCYENIHNWVPKKRDSIVDVRCYELADYEKESLRQINELAENGYGDNIMQKEHMEYLSHLLQRLMGILDCEKSVGAPTEPLENEIKRIRELFLKVEKAKVEKTSV